MEQANLALWFERTTVGMEHNLGSLVPLTHWPVPQVGRIGKIGPQLGHLWNPARGTIARHDVRQYLLAA